MKATLFICGLSLVTLGWCQAQQEPDPQQIADDAFEDLDVEGALEDVYENLAQIRSSPLDLNKATAEDLRFLQVLNDTQIDDLIRYRSEEGPFLDIYELQVIRGFDLSLIARLEPFIKVTNAQAALSRSLLQRLFSEGEPYLVSRYERTLEQKKGFTSAPGSPSAYNGSPDKLYLRFRTASRGDFSAGFTGEKDAGEKMAFRADHPFGFDFTSIHVQLENKGKLKNLIAGDFQAQFGQGLIFGGPFGLGKGGETVLSARKSNVGFLPYTSVDESAYQRGVAVTIAPMKNILLSAFYSGVRRDAAADSMASSAVTSLPASGYHRTTTEILNRKRQRERNYGAALQWQKNNFQVGAILNVTNFSLPVHPTPSPYNQFVFEGTRNLNTGVHFQYRRANVSLFGEAAQSLDGGAAFLAGILVNPHTDLDIAILLRNYAKIFYTAYSNAFSENTKPQNERGLYWGLKYHWTSTLDVTAYADLFSFPWLSFRRYAPSSGYEWMVRANYNPSRAAGLFMQFREECKDRNLPDASPLYRVETGRKRSLTIDCDYGARGKIRLKSRVQCSSYLYDSNHSQGITVLQDISFSLGPFRITGRHAVFDTEDFDNRQYVYENDAWLAFSFPAYSGTGVRNYVLVEYKAGKKLTLWGRFATTRMQHSDEIGSGQDRIDGNTRNDVKFEAKFSF